MCFGVVVRLSRSFISDHLVLLPSDIVLSQVTVLAFAIRVVRLVSVLAISSQFSFAFPMVAVVTHVLSVVLLVAVRAHEDVRRVA